MPQGTDTGNRTTADPDRPFTLEPDRAFLGCLMQTPVNQAHRLLAGMRPDDARSLLAQRVLYLVIQLVAREIKPDPVVLLSAARNHGWLTSEHQHQQFAEWLIDTFRTAPVPDAASVLKRDLLETALRRALTEQATRVLDVVAHGRIDRVRELATLDTDRIADLWDRYSESARTITPADPETAATGQISASSDRLSQPQPARATTTAAESISAAEKRSAPAQSDQATLGSAA